MFDIDTSRDFSGYVGSQSAAMPSVMHSPLPSSPDLNPVASHVIPPDLLFEDSSLKLSYLNTQTNFLGEVSALLCASHNGREGILAFSRGISLLGNH